MNDGSLNSSTRTLRRRRPGRPRAVHPGGILPGDTVVRWSSEDRYRLWNLKNLPEHENMNWEEFQKLGYFPGRTWVALSMAYSRVQRRLERGASVGAGLKSLKRPPSTLRQSSEAHLGKRLKREGHSEGDDDVDEYVDTSSEENSSEGDSEDEEDTDEEEATPADQDDKVSTRNILTGGPTAPDLHSSLLRQFLSDTVESKGPCNTSSHHVNNNLKIPRLPMHPPPTPTRQTSNTPIHNEPLQSTPTPRQPSIPGTPANSTLPDQFFTHAVQNLIQCAHSLAQHKTYLTRIEGNQATENTNLRQELDGVKKELFVVKKELNDVKDELKQVKETDNTTRLRELEDRVNGMQSSAELEAIKAQMNDFQKQFRLYDRLKNVFDEVKNYSSN
ncbi:hypothetical protein BDV06DRAFT_17777 [Aspergillus oleicola]